MLAVDVVGVSETVRETKRVRVTTRFASCCNRLPVSPRKSAREPSCEGESKRVSERNRSKKERERTGERLRQRVRD